MVEIGPKKIDRRRLLLRATAAVSVLGLAACDKLSNTPWWQSMLGSAEDLDRNLQKLLAGRPTMAPEFAASQISPTFKPNGTLDPDTPVYAALAQNNFVDYQLEVAGLVEQPGKFSLADLQALPSRTQITRHDCVEGWSVIGKWMGARLSAVLERVKLKPEARYIVFRCFDSIDDDQYYESIDMDDALHEQTILAYELNDKPLEVANGAPLRLRVERQLGYKMAKYVMKIEAVASFADIGGAGGYWEDQGYTWYAGI